MNQTSQTRRILAHLSGQIGSLPDRNTPGLMDNQSRILVVLSGNPIGYEETLKDLLLLKSKGWTFDLAFSANAEALMDSDKLIHQLSPINVIGRDMHQLKNYSMNHLKGVMAPLVTHNTARKLSLGIQDGLVPNLLWQALWDGIPVYMNLESLKTYHGRPTQNAQLVRLIDQTIIKLKEMGVSEIERPSEILKRYGNGLLKERNLTAQTADSHERSVKSVVTEQDILSQAKDLSVYEIPAGAIVTPLARDTAAARGIRLNRK